MNAAPIVTADRRTPIRNFVAALLSPGACVPSAGAGGSPLGAFRHGDCPAATGQDDSGRWRASSVMSTKPLFRIESIRLVVKRHRSEPPFQREPLSTPDPWFRHPPVQGSSAAFKVSMRSLSGNPEAVSSFSNTPRSVNRMQLIAAVTDWLIANPREE